MAQPPRLLTAGLFACCCLLLLVGADPIPPANKCTVGCHGMHTDQSYKEGQIYTYALEGTSVSSVTEGQGEATLKLKADVELAVKPDCVRQIRLKNVQVNGAAVSQPELEKYALQFNYHHGHIDSELCAEPGDTQASLNIKRAVISLFQSSALQEEGSTSRHEIDVLGGCPTDFSFYKDGDSQVVHKSRNLNLCANREHIRQGLFAGVANPAAGVHATPLLAGQQKVELRFKAGVLEKAVSTESYRLRPFGNGDAAAKTVVESALTLKGRREAGPAAPVSQPRSLGFEAPHGAARASLEAVERALQAVHAAGEAAVRPEAARLFSELVRALRASSKKDILTVYHRVKAGAGYDKERDRALLLDALYRAGSAEAAEVAVELIKNKEIGELQAGLYYASLAFVRHVSPAAVAAVASLLEQPGLSRLGYLGVGQMIGRYCGQHDCEAAPEVRKALEKLVARAGDGRPADRAAEDAALAALKALGNAKWLDEPSQRALARLAADRQAKRRLRVAAIEALPGRCAMAWKRALYGPLADRREDSEIRIKCYLALVACPCNDAAGKIREVLQSETSRQFGSFVAGHLRNLRASADPGREAARAYLGQIRPRGRFPEDVRKYSFNAELSHSLEAFGLGSAAEANVIYSQDSFLPRSASLNLTSELFGHAFNFLEVDARAENLDRVVEHLFGPKGVVTGQRPQEAARDGFAGAAGLARYARERLEAAIGRAGGGSRARRELRQPELDKFARGVQLRANNELHEAELELDLSLRLFGTELGYLSYGGLDARAGSPRAVVDALVEQLERALAGAKSLEHELESHVHFLDAELVYPTGLGLGLGLGLAGSGVVRAKTSAKLDVAAILADPRNAALKLAVEPSASVELVGELAVSDGFGGRAGLKLVGSLHTATGYDLSLKLLNDAKGFDLSLGLPKRKQEIVSLTSDVLYSDGPNYAPVKFAKGKERSDCFDQFTAPLGLTVCGHLAYPYENIAALQKRPLYPLSGPFRLQLSVEANDVSSYHLRALYDDKKPKERSLEILLETPNSRTSRYVSLQARASLEPEARLRLALDSPIKRAAAEAVLKRDDKEHSLSLTVTNDQIEYFGRLGVLSLGAGKYKPVLEYKLPEHLERLAGGGAGKQPGGQLHQVQGTVEMSQAGDGARKYAFDKVQLVSGGKRVVGLDGSLAYSPKSLEVDLGLGYAADERLQLKLDGKRLGEQHFSLQASAQPSRHPASSLGLDWEYKRQRGLFEHRLALVQGADLKASDNRLELVQRAEYSLEPAAKFGLTASSRLAYPRVGLLARLDAALSRSSAKAEAELKYDKFRVAADLAGKLGQKQPDDYELLLNAELLENKVRLEARRTVTDPASSRFENSLKLTPGGTYRADASVKWQVEARKDGARDATLAVDAELDLNGRPVVRVDTGLECTAERLNNHVQLYVNKNKYVDYSLRLQRAGPGAPSGSLGLALKQYLQAAGQFAYQNGKGTASLSLDVPRLGRKLKGSGELSVTGSRHQASLELAYDAERDPAKKIRLTSDTDLTAAAVDSTNGLELAGYKTELRLRAKRQGELLNGRQEAEVELTLPGGRHLSLAAERSASRRPDERLDGKLHLELADAPAKGAPARRLGLDGSSSLHSAKDYLFESAYELKYVQPDGKELLYKLGLKNLARAGADEPEKKTAGLDVAVSGSLLDYSASASGALDYDPSGLSLRAAASRGDDLSLKSNVDYGRGNNVDKPATFKGFVEAKLPSDKLKSVRFEFDETVLDQLDENGVFEYTKAKTLTYNGDKKIKLNTHYKHSGDRELDGLGRFERALTSSLKILDKPALTLTENYQHDLSGELKKVSEKAGVQYGDKAASADLGLQWRADFEQLGLTGKFATPFESLKSIDLQIEHKRETDQSRKTESAVTIDGKKYTQSTEIELGDAPGIHLVFTYPSGSTELLTKFKKLGENEYSGNYKLTIPQGFVAVDGRVKLESVDDFVINVNFDSDLAKYRKVHAEIANKLSSQDGRRIFITVTSDGKNLVTGSTNYKRHEEDKQVTLEGNGSLKIGENTKSSSFKYVRKQLTREADKEVGVGIMLNASFGPSGIVGELKLSDKEFHVFNSYCEQSKDCAHFKLQSTLDTDKLTHLNHNLQVEVNLKKFNVPVEFGLLSSTKYADYSLDHQANLYLHSSKDRTQYTYHLYFNKRESAVVLTLPSRELAVVAFHDVPAVKHSGAYKIDVSLYLDRKNKPSEKTSLLLVGDVSSSKNSAGVNGEAKFSYPSQTKELVVKGKVFLGPEQLLDASFDLDVFGNKNDKITASAKLARADAPRGYNVTGSLRLHSKGQKLDVKADQHLAVTGGALELGSSLSYTDKHQKPKSAGAHFSAGPQRVELYAFVPGRELVKAHAGLSLGKDQQRLESVLSLLGHKAVAASVEFKNYNSFQFEYGRKDDAKNKLVANGKIVLGQLAQVHADAYKDGAKQELFHLLIHLEENKLTKPDFGYNNKNIIGLVNRYRELVSERLKEGKQAGEEMAKELVDEANDLFEHLRKAQPNLKPLVAYFDAELSKLKSELHADLTIKEINDIFNNTLGGLIAAVVETAKKFAEHFEELRHQLNDIIGKLQEAARATYPQLRESFDKLFKVSVAIFDSAAKLASAYVEAVLKVLNEHQKDIEELVSVASELVQDVAKIVYKGASQIEKEVKEFVQLLAQQLRALPVYEVAQNLYRELLNYKIPDYILAPVEEFCSNIKNILPTQELKDFFATFYNYVLKHAKHEKVDDSSEVKKLYSQALGAVHSILGLLQAHASAENVFGFLEAQLPVDLSYLKRLPGLSTVKFSVLRLLLNRELPSAADLYYTYRPVHHPEDSIPPAKKYGYFADGGLFVTFDGSQFVFPGSCQYVLAQDARDGNFSVVGEYVNGNLVSVSLTEPGESVTIKANGNLLVNNKPADYPASTRNINAFFSGPLRKLVSKYGVKLVCQVGSGTACYVRVSGFYHAKLRGLLGDANNEPHDDYVLPSGKVAASASEFGNAYKLSASCAAASAKEAEAARSPACTKYFAGGSPLRGCFDYVDPKPYRASCDQLAGQKTGPCAVASSYAAACLVQNVLVSLPSDCIQCKVGDSLLSGGDAFSVKIPKKQADIVIVVEQEADNEKAFKDFVKPIIGELRTELKQHGITDVFIGLIGFGENLKWPRHYTSNNNVNIESGDFANMLFTNTREPTVSLQEFKEDKQGAQKLKYLRQRLDVELGTIKLNDAYESAVHYPFRPAAAKAVIGLISMTCEKSPLPLSLQDYRLLLGKHIYSQLGLTYYHVSPMKELEIAGDPKKSVVGYDKDYVYTFADSKKKPLEGSAELRAKLSHIGGDVCANFAVTTGGAAFSSHTLLEAKPNQQAQYVKVAARRIAENLASVEIEQDCVCGAEASYGYTAQVVSRPQCKLVSREDKRHKSKP